MTRYTHTHSLAPSQPSHHTHAPHTHAPHHTHHTTPHQQTEMLTRATRERDESVVTVSDWAGFADAIACKRLALAPVCGKRVCEEEVGVRSKQIASARNGADGEGGCAGDAGDKRDGSTDGPGGVEGVAEGKSASAKALCVPLDQERLAAGERCFACGLPASCRMVWGRSY